MEHFRHASGVMAEPTYSLSPAACFPMPLMGGRALGYKALHGSEPQMQLLFAAHGTSNGPCRGMAVAHIYWQQLASPYRVLLFFTRGLLVCCAADWLLRDCCEDGRGDTLPCDENHKFRVDPVLLPPHLPQSASEGPHVCMDDLPVRWRGQPATSPARPPRSRPTGAAGGWRVQPGSGWGSRGRL